MLPLHQRQLLHPSCLPLLEASVSRTWLFPLSFLDMWSDRHRSYNSLTRSTLFGEEYTEEMRYNTDSLDSLGLFIAVCFTE